MDGPKEGILVVIDFFQHHPTNGHNFKLWRAHGKCVTFLRFPPLIPVIANEILALEIFEGEKLGRQFSTSQLKLVTRRNRTQYFFWLSVSK